MQEKKQLIGKSFQTQQPNIDVCKKEYKYRLYHEAKKRRKDSWLDEQMDGMFILVLRNFYKYHSNSYKFQI